MNNHPKISAETLVIVSRTVKAFNETNERGPKTIAQAVRDGDMTSSSGTVGVRFTIADGEHAGANAYMSNGSWFAQYNPNIEAPDGSPLFWRDARMRPQAMR